MCARDSNTMDEMIDGRSRHLVQVIFFFDIGGGKGNVILHVTPTLCQGTGGTCKRCAR